MDSRNKTIDLDLGPLMGYIKLQLWVNTTTHVDISGKKITVYYDLTDNDAPDRWGKNDFIISNEQGSIVIVTDDYMQIYKEYDIDVIAPFRLHPDTLKEIKRTFNLGNSDRTELHKEAKQQVLRSMPGSIFRNIYAKTIEIKRTKW